MAKRIIITDDDLTGDEILFVQREALPQTISGLSAGMWTILNTVASVPVEVGAQPQVWDREPAGPTNRSIHNGHSLTDAYLAGPWPGGLASVRDGLMDPDTWDVTPHLVVQNTIPGSPLQWRWDVGPDDPEALDARRTPEHFDTLVITEGGPPPRPTNTQDMAYSLGYLCNFVANMVVNGRGNEAIVWSIWPAINGPGTSTENPVPSGTWAGFDFRSGLDEYNRAFRMMAEYATWKIKAHYPTLPEDWRVWMFPGDRWMARVYDDMMLGLVPGISVLQDLFNDDIHPTDVVTYGLNCFMATCLYQVNLQEAENVWVREGVTQAQAEYFWGIAWEIATAEKTVGMGGVQNDVPVWTPDMGDLLPNWEFDGSTPIDPEEPGEGELPTTGVLLAARPGVYEGSSAATFQPLLTPTISGDAFTLTDVIVGVQATTAEETYIAVKVRYTSGRPASAIGNIIMLSNGPDSWSHPNVSLTYNGYINRPVARLGAQSDSVDRGGSAPIEDGQAGVVEVRVSSGGAGIAQEGAAWDDSENPNGLAHGPFSHMHIGHYAGDWPGGTTEILAAVVMDRWPTPQEREGILDWLNATQ